MWMCMDVTDDSGLSYDWRGSYVTDEASDLSVRFKEAFLIAVLMVDSICKIEETGDMYWYLFYTNKFNQYMWVV